MDDGLDLSVVGQSVLTLLPPNARALEATKGGSS